VYSCSVACSKIHKQTHEQQSASDPAQPGQEPQSRTDAAVSAQTTSTQPTTAQAPRAAGAFPPPALTALLAQNPALKQELAQLYAYLCDPDASAASRPDCLARLQPLGFEAGARPQHSPNYRGRGRSGGGRGAGAGAGAGAGRADDQASAAMRPDARVLSPEERKGRVVAGYVKQVRERGAGGDVEGWKRFLELADACQ
jgi:hypothetical protein